MLFEVIDKDNNVVFWTEHYSCIPDKEQLQQINRNYRFRVEGKIVALNKLLDKVDIPAIQPMKPTRSKRLF